MSYGQEEVRHEALKAGRKANHEASVVAVASHTIKASVQLMVKHPGSAMEGIVMLHVAVVTPMSSQGLTR